MLANLFNYDNPVWRFIGKFWDVVVLNILWIICSIPIFTIGASTTAMYYVTLKLARDDDGYTIRSFFKSFKENFKQATVIWLFFLVLGAVLIFDLFYFIRLAAPSTFRTVMLSVFVALFFVWLAMLTYVFPLQARFYNPVKRTIFNSLFMSFRHIFHTISMIAVDLVIIYLMFTYVPQLCVFGVALVAFFNAYMLNGVFKKYMPEEEEEEELRPLFADDDKAAKTETEN